MSILDTIIEEKRKHVAECKKLIGQHEFEHEPLFNRKTISLKERMLQPNSSGIIAEFKRQSPSKGIINDKVLPQIITKAYQDAGVAGVSILTDTPFFGGFPDDVILSRKELSIPILRKDFIVDEYQLFEAKALGADVILLIAAVLEKEEVAHLAKIASSLGLEILFEVHDSEELEKICPEVTVVGVNNRNLKTFAVDLDQSMQLAKLIPDNFLKISESGIENPETIKKLKLSGLNGFLIGESFMKTDNPGGACKRFIEQLQLL